MQSEEACLRHWTPWLQVHLIFQLNFISLPQMRNASNELNGRSCALIILNSFTASIDCLQAKSLNITKWSLLSYWTSLTTHSPIWDKTIDIFATILRPLSDFCRWHQLNFTRSHIISSHSLRPNFVPLLANSAKSTITITTSAAHPLRSKGSKSYLRER